jgi:large subunit ribosomal protein L9
MKIILTENIEKVGVKGDIVNVKRGFARNYLVARNFAIYATPQNVKNLDSLKKQFAVEENKRFEYLKQIGEQISALNLSFVRKVDEHENMYGSVSESDIHHSLAEKKIDVPKAAIILEKHIKQLGEFEVPIHLHKDINVVLHGIVEKEAE